MTELDLWPHEPALAVDAAPASITTSQSNGSTVVRNVIRPSLTAYLPDPSRANGTAVVVAPGGAFYFLDWVNEGTSVAELLADRGIAAFVLKYRLEDTGPTDETYAAAMQVVMTDLIGQAMQGGVMIDSLVPSVRQLAYADGADAVRFLRKNADEWGFDPARLGFLGFSAGAYVATAVAATSDPAARPDFVAAIYGGQALAPLPENTPPLFAVVTADDLLSRRPCIETAQAWMQAGLPTELHVYEEGGHGFGTRTLGLPVDSWLDRLDDWLRARGILTEKAS